MTGQRLKEILDTVREQPDLAPIFDDKGKLVRTFCNIALDRVMGIIGIPRIINPMNGSPLMATDMMDYFEAHEDQYMKVTGDVACARASQGILVIACQHENMHSHVCPIYPTPMEMSGSWGKLVPLCSNVGKTIGAMRVSQAFRTEPAYYSTTLHP